MTQLPSHFKHSARILALWLGCLFGLAHSGSFAQSSLSRSAQQQSPQEFAKQPVAIAALRVRALGLQANGRPDLAAQVWNQILLADPANLEALKFLVWYNRHAGNVQQAAEMLRRLRTVDPAAIANAVLPSAEPSLAAGRSSQPTAAELSRIAAARRSGAAEAAAYRALQRNDLSAASDKFQAILAQNQSDAPALAGMGFVSMRRQNFAPALQWLKRAEQHGSRSAGVRQAVLTCRFWLAIETASTALVNKRTTDAEAAALSALHMEPDSPDATLMLARVRAAQGQPSAALDLYREVAQSSSASPANVADAWSGWMTASVALHQSPLILRQFESLSPETRGRLQQNTGFLASLAQTYAAAGQSGRAKTALQAVLTLPANAVSQSQRTGAVLQYASLCILDGHFEEATAAYRNLLAESPGNSDAWQGIVLAQHLSHNDVSAWRTFRKMPAPAETVSTHNPNFLMLLAGIQQSREKYASARNLLEQAQTLMESSGASSSPELLLQLAGIDLQMHQPSSAIPLYRKLIAGRPDDISAWTGLLNALHQAGEDREAEQAELTMPNPVRRRMESGATPNSGNVETYFETMAGVEQALGNRQATLSWLQRLDAIQPRTSAPPAATHIDRKLQEGWLEYNLHLDSEAERTVRPLPENSAAFNNASAAQREQLVMLTAYLAVRRASQLTASGNPAQGIAVLDAATAQVAGDPQGRCILAAGYLNAGDPAAALAIYQSVDMSKAAPGDMRAAVGAAMGMHDRNLAQQWLQQALAARPQDPALLLLAGEFAQSNGNLQLAGQYLHAALQAANRTAANTGSTDISESKDIVSHASDLLAAIEASYSGWYAASPYVSHFIGTPGTTQLTDVELPIEASASLAHRLRVTSIVRTVHLDSGAYSGAAGQPLGTLTGSTAAPAVPGSGAAVKVQLASQKFAASIGVSPVGFPVINLTAAAMLHPPNRPWTLSFTRDSIRESQLAYAGLHDPGQPANVWGGVVANLATLQYARGASNSGWYATASAGAVTGRHVRVNPQVSGDAGAYRQVWKRESATLRLGFNFYAQHDTRNELLYTYGHGGYFSPAYYLLPTAPLTLAGHSGSRLHYRIAGSLGPQIFSESSAPYYPLDPSLQTLRNNPVFPSQTTIGVNYGAEGHADYLFGAHWGIGAFFSANNAAKYNQQLGGFSLHYMVRSQRGSRLDSIGWLPYSGQRPFLVPRSGSQP